LILKDGKVVASSPWLARQVVNSEHELGLHGYNHVSLWQSDWDNMDLIVTALQAVRKRWRLDNLGPLPVSYVPPSNDIDSTGLNKLTEGMPSIKYFCSLFLGEKEFGEAREFDTDPHNKLLYDIPRMTYGYVYSDALFFLQENLYIFTGIWNHFIHTDDVFHGHKENSEYRGRNQENLWWRKTPDSPKSLYASFRNWIKMNQTIHPYMRFKTISKAAPIIQSWRNLSVRHVDDSLSYSVHMSNPESSKSYWNIYISESEKEEFEKILNNTASEYSYYRLWDGYLYELVTNRSSLELPNYHYKAKRPSNELLTIQDDAKSRYIEYMKAGTVEYFLKMRFEEALELVKQYPDSAAVQETAIKLALESESVGTAISILEKKLLRHNEWKQEDLDRLVKYYFWDEQVESGWDFLKQRLQKYETSESVKISHSFLKKLGNPPDQDADWLIRRELEISPQKEEILVRLAKMNQTPENWPKVKKTFISYLPQLTHSDSAYFYFLQRSFWYDEPEVTLSFLGTFPKTSHDQLRPLSDQIADLYAYQDYDFTQALYWADRTETIEPKKKLDWYLAAKRYSEQDRIRYVRK